MPSPTDVIDLTADGVEFAPWSTDVENDDLQLVRLSFAGSDEVSFPQEGFTLRVPPEEPALEAALLTAVFLSRQQRAVVTFTFKNVSAFRVLDEHGLTEIWDASSKQPRPASTTFRVRGHKWQDESLLSWILGSNEERYSLMIATGWECLEVVTYEEPEVVLRPALVTPYTSEHLR